MLTTKGGWNAEWKHGVKGTNLSPTKLQTRTWFLWGYSPLGGQSILAKVEPAYAGGWELHDGTKGGKLVKNYANLSTAKKAAERLFGIVRPRKKARK